MTKDEMKNRISMALKDPILQQGFEIICMENAELKKENDLLNEWKDKRVEEYCNPCIFRFKIDSDKLTRFEKENAELKKQLFTKKNERNTFLSQNEQYEKDLIDFNGKLTNEYARQRAMDFLKEE